MTTIQSVKLIPAVKLDRQIEQNNRAQENLTLTSRSRYYKGPFNAGFPIELPSCLMAADFAIYSRFNPSL